MNIIWYVCLKNALHKSSCNFVFFVCVLALIACSKDDNDSEVPLTIEADYEITGNKYYVDAAAGNDANSGTMDDPFKSIQAALKSTKGGDGIVLRTGNYGDLNLGTENGKPIPDVFTDMVTIVAQPGHKPELEHVALGTWSDESGANQIPWSRIGNSNLSLRLDGINILDQLAIEGCRYVEIRNCKISTRGNLTELTASGSGITVMNGQYISLYKNLIHHSGVGLSVMTRDFVMIDNEIKECTHDGIKFYGGDNILIEGNRIHDLDDGLYDNDLDPGKRNNHVDGIHIHSIIHEGGYMNPRWAGGANNVTFRGNLIYHIESMAVMINQNDSGLEGWNNFIWENNLFGPVEGRLFIQGSSFGGSFIFRHNTVLYAPKDQWFSIFGRMMNTKHLDNPKSQSYHVQVWGNPKNHQYYNNIFTAVGSSENAGIYQDEGIVSNNIIIDDANNLPYESIPGNISDYLLSGSILGRPKEGSPAIDAGRSDLDIPLKDFWGKVRINQPDIGAVEY